jgi:hypothetical protein
MTNRDTYDINAYAQEQRDANPRRATNIQPALLVKLMTESEPCLFANKSEPVVSPAIRDAEIPTRDFPSAWARDVVARMRDIARWHAQLQVSFERSFARECGRA